MKEYTKPTFDYYELTLEDIILSSLTVTDEIYGESNDNVVKIFD